MKKVWKGAIVSALLIGISCVVFCMTDTDSNEYVNLYGISFLIGIYSAISFVSFLSTGIATVIRKDISPYCVFAVVNAVIVIGTVGYSFYDIKIDTSFLAGVTGYLVLIFFVPFNVVLLIIDLIVWLINKKKTDLS